MKWTVILCVCLALLLVLLLVCGLRYRQLKRELRRFSAELEKRKAPDYTQPLKVHYFDSDILTLANRINEHIEVQQQLSTAYLREQEKLHTVISGISHDFRTPLTAALGYLQMMEKSDLLSTQNEAYLEIAIRKTAYLKELSDAFFELSMIESNHEELPRVSINLSNLVWIVSWNSMVGLRHAAFVRRWQSMTGLLWSAIKNR